MGKHIIWSNMNLDIEDWRDGYKEFLEINGIDDRDPDDEDDIYDWMVELNDEYFDDERMNCNIHTDGRIIAIANLGFWNGRRIGYKLLDHNVNDCLQLNKVVTMQNSIVTAMIYVAHNITMTEVIVSHIENSDRTLQATKQIIFAGNCMKVKLLRKTSQDTHGL